MYAVYHVVNGHFEYLFLSDIMEYWVSDFGDATLFPYCVARYISSFYPGSGVLGHVVG